MKFNARKEKRKSLRNTFLWTSASAEETMVRVPTVSAKAKLAPNDRGPKGGLFMRKARYPFTKEDSVLCKDFAQCKTTMFF